jgi:uncharacterized delta-60 repeat protein
MRTNDRIVSCSVILLLLVCWALEARSQVDTAWVRHYDGPASGADRPYALQVDADGNVYVTGFSDGTASEGDYATIKYSPDGDTLWVRRYDGPGGRSDNAYALAVDASGNVYVTGVSGQGLGGGVYDYTTIKYASNGDTVWVRHYDGPASLRDEAYALKVDPAGNVYVTGRSSGDGSHWDYATIKYNSDGDTLWVRRYDGLVHGNDSAHELEVDSDGNVYVTGESWGSGGDYEYATIKYDAQGDIAWERRYHGEFSSGPEALQVDAIGNVYVTGGSEGWLTDYDFATIKYNADGDTVWVRRYDGPTSSFDGATALGVDYAGNVYVTGLSESDGGDIDYITLKYNAAGETAWVRRYDGPAGGDDGASALHIDPFGNVYVAGSSEGIGTGYDFATLKYNPDGDLLWECRFDGIASGDDFARDLFVDASGNVYVAGISTGLGTDYDYVVIKYVQATGPPIANDDSYGARGDATLYVVAPGVLANDSDPDGSPLTAILESDVSHGSLELNADGSFLYTPSDPSFSGEDQFAYYANDGTANSPTPATVHLFVKPGAPVAPGDFDEDGFITSTDLAAEIDALFRNGPDPTDGGCTLAPRGDIDCDGFNTAHDLAKLIDHLFAGSEGPCDPCR